MNHDGTLTFGETEDGQYTLTSTLFVPHPVETLWPFFANAENLAELTPDDMHFEIVTPTPIVMGIGTLIDYRIKMGVLPMKWRSEIVAWEPNVRFADKQVIGPYQSWLHMHTFEPVDGGTLLGDEVTYKPPMAFLSHGRFVKPKLREIFEYRADVMRKKFGSAGA